jgi:hypothetical protein
MQGSMVLHWAQLLNSEMTPPTTFLNWLGSSVNRSSVSRLSRSFFTTFSFL